MAIGHLIMMPFEITMTESNGDTKGPEFKEWPKIHRLNRDIIITEKIDGTNAQIYIDESENFFAGSRTRWVTPENDNFGFGKWAYEHKEDLLKLGPGRHYGEWWGNGIQRGYGQPNGMRWFSLFNTTRWKDMIFPLIGLTTVPILYEGPFSQAMIEHCLKDLKLNGSKAAPFMDPEGIVVYHTHGNVAFKVTLGGDGHKGEK